MIALLATPQGRPTPVAVNVSHALVGAATLGIARSLGFPTAGLFAALVVVWAHAELDAPLAQLIASIAD